MGEAKRRTPGTMPNQNAINRVTAKIDKPFLVAGSRGTKSAKNRKPDFDVHSVLDLAGGNFDECNGKHAVIFVHGYNVDRKEALTSAAGFFGNLQKSLTRDGQSIDDYAFILFTWPGDVGPLWFSTAQEYAQHSGVALYRLVRALRNKYGAAKTTLFTHSLGAHVGLRSASINAERLFRRKTEARFDNVLLLAPAVENDVFQRPHLFDDYHFPDAPFAAQRLHIFASRADEVLKKAYSVSEFDAALGYAGPESMKPLKSVSRRVGEVLGEGAEFRFELHDFSPKSTTIINPKLHAQAHSDYWTRQEQTDYYVNLLL